RNGTALPVPNCAKSTRHEGATRRKRSIITCMGNMPNMRLDKARNLYFANNFDWVVSANVRGMTDDSRWRDRYGSARKRSRSHGYSGDSGGSRIFRCNVFPKGGSTTVYVRGWCPSAGASGPTDAQPGPCARNCSISHRESSKLYILFPDRVC